ncbi:MAG TPA: hypothetical protein VKU44_05770 [Terriglobia bacterium]|nr:hypothetical protein [Terriglobia bacterium]
MIMVCAPPASARDREFGLLVHQIETEYHAKRSHRFLIGFASRLGNVVITFWRPYGVRNFKLAMWDGKQLSYRGNDKDFQKVVGRGLQQGWLPLVQVWSRRDGERTYVFAKDSGKYVKLLVATVETDDAVVVQVQVNPDKLGRSIAKWEGGSRHCDQCPAPGQQDSTPSDAFSAVLAEASSGRAPTFGGR